MTTGKAHLDVLQALEDLGISRRRAAEIGINIFKVGMSWPLEPDGIREFAEGLDEIIVVEEKRGVIEKPAQGTTLQLAGEASPADHRQARRAR